MSGSGSAARLMAASLPHGRLAQDGEAGQGDDRECHVAVPPHPGADLIVAQPKLALKPASLASERRTGGAFWNPGAAPRWDTQAQS